MPVPHAATMPMAHAAATLTVVARACMAGRREVEHAQVRDLGRQRDVVVGRAHERERVHHLQGGNRSEGAVNGGATCLEQA